MRHRRSGRRNRCVASLVETVFGMIPDGRRRCGPRTSSMLHKTGICGECLAITVGGGRHQIAELATASTAVESTSRHAASTSFNSCTMTLRSFPKTFDARAKPPSFVNGVRSKLSMSISRLVAMWSRIMPSH